MKRRAGALLPAMNRRNRRSRGRESSVCWDVAPGRTEMPTVDISKVARALNLKERRVQQLVNEGMPREARGQYDPIKCAAWYIRYLQRAIERKPMPTFEEGSAGERAARLRILRTQADLKEIKVADQRTPPVALPTFDAALLALFTPNPRP